MIASPCKLKSGEWGARVATSEGLPMPGDEIIIETRDGRRWPMLVTAIVASFDEATLVATERVGASPGRKGKGEVGREVKGPGGVTQRKRRPKPEGGSTGWVWGHSDD